MYAWLVTGAVMMALGVLAGAFGAHALRGHVTPELLAVYQTGVLYHLLHALALVALGLGLAPGSAESVARARLEPALRRSAALLLFGIVVFSGSLYALVLTGERWLGMVTPVGGVAFVLGWLLLAVAAARARS
jgi:uncharacterized membrane protein YgdD (TMEM256/DUF423 family)